MRDLAYRSTVSTAFPPFGTGEHDAHPPVCNHNLQENGSQELVRVQPHSWRDFAFRKLRTPLNMSSNPAFQPQFPPVTRSSLLAEWSDIIKQGANGYCHCSQSTYRWCGSSQRTIPTKDDVHDLRRAPIPQSHLSPLTGAEFACFSAGPATSRFGTCIRHSSRAMITKCRANTEAQQISMIFAHAKE